MEEEYKIVIYICGIRFSPFSKKIFINEEIKEYKKFILKPLEMT